MRHEAIFETPFELESGEVLPSLTVAYHTYGTLSPRGDNVVWVMHGLTANSDVADWWPHTVEKGKFLDPDRWFVVCANMLGSCYGTTGPMSVNPTTGHPWYGGFPAVTIRDQVKVHLLLAERLGIKRVHELIGVSLGGFQALEWVLMAPETVENVFFCATSARCSPWLAAFNKTMLMAIETDGDYGRADAGAARKGLAAARSLALLSYRGPYAYNRSQKDTEEYADPFFHRVQTYQEHQGEKLCRRFDAYTYVTVCRSADSHNAARGRGELACVLGCIRAHTLVVAISSDILFPVDEVQQLALGIPGAEFRVMESDYAHDGFLIEHEKLNALVADWRARREKLQKQQEQ